jgi:hypothetical protein
MPYRANTQQKQYGMFVCAIFKKINVNIEKIYFLKLRLDSLKNLDKFFFKKINKIKVKFNI